MCWLKTKGKSLTSSLIVSVIVFYLDPAWKQNIIKQK